MLFLVMLVTVTLLPFVGTITEKQPKTGFWELPDSVRLDVRVRRGVVLIDAATPNKRLATVFGIYSGIVAGLVGALASARCSISSRDHGTSESRAPATRTSA